ncbi:MAG TPA: plasmid partitioning protein RepB, partial [Paracoccaceae bacterium]
MEAETKPRFPNTGAMSGIKSTLKDLSSNAVREIAPEMIDEDGPKDRLTFPDADVAQLAESIRLHGQQVPIMVRPLPERPGYYRIVYGRRRLRALRLLGLSAKALVRSLSDEEAVLAQGQENAQRLDPSFIEKALFVSELASGGYDHAVIMDALAIDKPMLSRMNKVARSIPAAVIQLIGPAHGIGRRRWEDLADAIRTHNLELAAVAEAAGVERAQSSDDRFARISDASMAAIRKSSTGNGFTTATLNPVSCRCRCASLWYWPVAS